MPIAILFQVRIGHSVTMDDRKRSVYPGSSQQIADAIFDVAYNVSFCSYPDESPRVAKAKLHVDSIRSHSALLSKLQLLQPNLSFPKRALQRALRIVAARRKWKLEEPAMEDWVDTLSRRIRNMCRVVSQALQKDPYPAWLQPLMGGDVIAAAPTPTTIRDSESEPNVADDTDSSHARRKRVEKLEATCSSKTKASRGKAKAGSMNTESPTLGWDKELRLAWSKMQMADWSYRCHPRSLTTCPLISRWSQHLGTIRQQQYQA